MEETQSEGSFATVEGIRLHFVEQGSGSPVVLLHGFASSLDVWNGVMPQLARRHRTVALDLRGFGSSDRSAGDYSPRGQATLVWALLDQLGIREAALVGHSWGASVVLAMALAAPERTSSITLYSAWVYEEQLSWPFRWSRAGGVGEYLFRFNDEHSIRSQLRLAFHDKKYVTRARVEEVAARMAVPGAREAGLATMRAMHFSDQQRRYSTLRMPSLVLWGMGDEISAPRFANRLATDLHARLVMFPACGHFPMVEAAEASSAALVDFLGESKRWNPLAWFRRRARGLHRRVGELRDRLRARAEDESQEGVPGR
ncbi:MAG TPA: alpha/beta fold hydrolase [Myxococcaceae bacterium]|nr:alpha/beta fold hydrolase [Myxococcaceae bacterium]